MKIKFPIRPAASEVHFFIGIPAVIWQVIFFYLPLGLMLVTSFVSFSESGTITGITLEKIGQFIEPTYLRVIASSLLLAISTAVICFFIAYPLAYFIAFNGKRFKNLLLFLLIVPFWTNFLLHVYAWFFVLEKRGFINNMLGHLGLIHEPFQFLNSIFSIMVMMVYYYLPFMVLPIYSSLERFDRRLLEASLDLGANWFQTFRRVMLPVTMRGVRAGFFLVYIPAFGEFAIPELMGGDREMFVGNVVSQYILGDETGSLGSAFTVLSGAFLLASSLFLYWLLGRMVKGAKS